MAAQIFRSTALLRMWYCWNTCGFVQRSDISSWMESHVCQCVHLFSDRASKVFAIPLTPKTQPVSCKSDAVEANLCIQSRISVYLTWTQHGQVCCFLGKSLILSLPPPLLTLISLSLYVISVQFLFISSSLWGTDQMIKDSFIFPIRPPCLCFPQSSWKHTLHTLMMNTASEEQTVCWWTSPRSQPERVLTHLELSFTRGRIHKFTSLRF